VALLPPLFQTGEAISRHSRGNGNPGRAHRHAPLQDCFVVLLLAMTEPRLPQPIPSVYNSVRMRQDIEFIDRHSRVRGNKDLDSCFYLKVPPRDSRIRHSGGSRNPGMSRRKPGTRKELDPVFQRGDVWTPAFAGVTDTEVSRHGFHVPL
jgi:hypothetical protein